MLQILVYGDSLTWGIIPDSRGRWPFETRWPGVLERALLEAGHDVRVIEDCLNGRRTVWDDPFKPGRNGRIGLEQRIEVNSPLALVVLLLGTNDFQSVHEFNAGHSAQGIASLVRAVKLVTVLAFDERRRADGEMRATLALASLGNLSLGDAHAETP